MCREGRSRTLVLAMGIMLAAVMGSGCLPPGKYHCSHGEGVSFEPGVPVTDICPEVDRVHAAGAKLCDSADGDTSRIEITVEGHDFMCGDRMVHGCASWPMSVYVRDETLLPDEMGHLIWYSCFQRSGEQDLPDGRITYDPDFQAFVDSLSQ